MSGPDEELEARYGARFFDREHQHVIEASPDDLYFYQVYVGQHQISVERGDCVYYLSEDRLTAYQKRGPVQLNSPWLATVIRGYMPEDKSCGLSTRTTLPYINGCSTRQIFPPERPGDPTLQLLDMPPGSSEQSHHIHSTVRVVHVLSGHGRCITGMDQKQSVRELYPGQTIVLEKMCPHHFETDDQRLIVLPLHIYSSIGQQEFSHPMFNGTYRTL